MGGSAQEPARGRPGQCTAWCAKRVAKGGRESEMSKGGEVLNVC